MPHYVRRLVLMVAWIAGFALMGTTLGPWGVGTGLVIGAITWTLLWEPPD